MRRVNFDFERIEDISPALEKCTAASEGAAIVSHHLAPLMRLADSFNVVRTARDNLECLGTGYDDLVIILLEPSDQEDSHSHGEIMASKGYFPAVKLLDDSLQFASRGKRTVENTIVLDARPLRTRKTRDAEGYHERLKNDSNACAAVAKSLTLLDPKVVVVCHRDKKCLDAGLPEFLVSSSERAGCTKLVRREDGHEFVQVCSYHPMFFARQGPDRRVMLEHLFNAALVVASNILVGRQFCGSGISKMRDGALHHWDTFTYRAERAERAERLKATSADMIAYVMMRLEERRVEIARYERLLNQFERNTKSFNHETIGTIPKWDPLPQH